MIIIINILHNTVDKCIVPWGLKYFPEMRKTGGGKYLVNIYGNTKLNNMVLTSLKKVNYFVCFVYMCVKGMKQKELK